METPALDAPERAEGATLEGVPVGGEATRWRLVRGERVLAGDCANKEVRTAQTGEEKGTCVVLGINNLDRLDSRRGGVLDELGSEASDLVLLGKRGGGHSRDPVHQVSGKLPGHPHKQRPRAPSPAQLARVVVLSSSLLCVSVAASAALGDPGHLGSLFCVRREGVCGAEERRRRDGVGVEALDDVSINRVSGCPAQS